ncbi:lipoprotein N-acyltransferase Lnb domain-containing protein [Lutibacter citreus]|uniref:lipoprotein N-acyltransferase Lnb domain-containing protein n=1 Tax=Lutibacter citreus TaxID=2138210 RepID=UPI000DBE8ECB|nr:DUF4105 domain-containing protein [Lutibacter citreus]
MKLKYLLITLIFLLTFSVSAQKLSEKATVSVVTCGPGNELYTTFGHSAFRVNDPLQKLDKIYNYGTFNFNAPNFYLNFAKGKLTYQLSTSPFSYFLRVYKYENRWVKTQELNLSSNEVQSFYNFLENNAKPENRDYQYDFFYDNCSTKIEVIIKTILHDKVHFNNNHIVTEKSHRDLIEDYTKNQKWGKFGIDLALGSVIDDIATKDEYKFLPDYIYLAVENAVLDLNNSEKPLVKNTKTILTSNNIYSASFLQKVTSPFSIILLLSLVILFLTYRNFKSYKRTKWLDFFLYFITGLVGVVVLLLWFATDHTATYKNLNFLWAFAPNIIVAFYLLKLKLPKWIITYNIILIILIAITFIIWLIKIQVFNYALIPLFVVLILRYLFLINFSKNIIK